MVFVGEQEVCRGGVPAPAPPTEGSSWAYDLWSSEAVAAAAAAAAAGREGGGGGSSGGGGGSGGGGKGGSGRARGAEVRLLTQDGAIYIHSAVVSCTVGVGVFLGWYPSLD